jgi:hypothetical protein
MRCAKGLILLACAGALGPLAGCSRNLPLPSGAGPIVPVEGRVLLGDQPLKGGIVRFHPFDFTEDNCLTQGFIDTEGRYSLSCYHPYQEKGAPSGKYRVTIEPASDEARQDGMVQGRYKDPEKTSLVITVEANAPAGAYDLKLEVSKKR